MTDVSWFIRTVCAPRKHRGHVPGSDALTECMVETLTKLHRGEIKAVDLVAPAGPQEA